MIYRRAGSRSCRWAAACALLVLLCALPATAEEPLETNKIETWLHENARDLRELGAWRVQWPDRSRIEPFFAFAFTSDDWFLYGELEQPLFSPAPAGDCAAPPCIDIAMVNLSCDSPCAAEIDPSAGAKCLCPQGVSLGRLGELGALVVVELGELPLRSGDDGYDVVLSFSENGIPPEMRYTANTRVRRFPSTSVHLVSSRHDSREIAVIDHNHSGIMVGVRVAGWVRHPDLDYIVVLLLCRSVPGLRRSGAEYFLKPVATDLPSLPSSGQSLSP